MSAASAKASSRGVSVTVGGDAELAGLGAREDAGREHQLLGDVDAAELDRNHVPVMSGRRPQRTSLTERGVGVDVADVGAEGDLQAAAEGVAVDGGHHRHGKLLPHLGDLLAEVGAPPGRAGGSRRRRGRPRRRRRPSP